MRIELLILLIYFSNAIAIGNKDLNLEVLELLGVPDSPRNFQHSLSNSATRFLRQVYSEISEEKKSKSDRRQKRALREENFISNFDRSLIKKCNNLISFSSKAKILDDIGTQKYLHLHFNMNDIPSDLLLEHSTLRVYHHPAGLEGILRNMEESIISVYEKIPFQFGSQKTFNEYRFVTSLNVTKSYKGWLDFNVTTLLSRWLKDTSIKYPELLIDETTAQKTGKSLENVRETYQGQMHLYFNRSSEKDPFIIGFFNGPQLINKMKKLRSKRDIISNRHPIPLKLEYRLPRRCQRLRFTVNIRDIHMDDWIIAPENFEAYFCGGDCYFPLSAHMNPTSHAIVQAMMVLYHPNLPKPCCAPTALDPMSILRYINEDNVNLMSVAQSIVKECGCL